MLFDTGLLEIGLMFVSIALGGAIASRINQAEIPIYIILGMVMGPYVAGEYGFFYVGQQSEVSHFVEMGAEIGVIFLLFFLGLEFNMQRIFENRDRIGKAGFLDLLNLIFGLLLGYILLRDVLGALLIGGIVYISSSAVITKSLIDMGWIVNDESEPILGILVFEDLFIALYIAFISSLLLETGGIGDLVLQMGLSVGFIVVLIGLVYFGTRIFDRVADATSDEMLILRIFAVTVFVAGLALAAGVSEAVAAFFIGMAFSDTQYEEDIEKLLEPVRYVFGSIFFFWIGMVTDPSLFKGILPLVLVFVVFTSLSKFLTGYSGGKIYDLDTRRSTRVGMGMIARGEFSLIIASLAAISGGVYATEIVTETVPAFAVVYVLIMSILGTSLMYYSGYFERAVKRIVGESRV
ncbi:MAG: cation:proton antiporter [Candidatus Hadarchaeota archaeon]